MAVFILNSFQHTPTTTTSTECINQLSPPIPFNSANFEDDADTIAKKKAKDEIKNQKPAAVSTDMDGEVVSPSSDRDSIYEPPRAVEEDLRGITSTNRRGWEDIESRAARRDMESRVARRDIESQQTRANNDDHEHTAGSINNDSIWQKPTQFQLLPTKDYQKLKLTW